MVWIVVPLPAVSRPSNSTTSRCPVSATQRAISLSSMLSGASSASYSSLLNSLIDAPPDAESHDIGVTCPQWVEPHEPSSRSTRQITVCAGEQC